MQEKTVLYLQNALSVEFKSQGKKVNWVRVAIAFKQVLMFLRETKTLQVNRSLLSSAKPNMLMCFDTLHLKQCQARKVILNPS